MRTIRLHFDPDGSGRAWVMEELDAEELAPDRFRLIDTPLLAEGRLNAEDVVAVEPLPDGGFRLLQVVASSGFSTHSWLLGEELLASPAYAALRERVHAAGGRAEVVFGGWLRVVLPPGSDFDVVAAVEALHRGGELPAGDAAEAPPRRWWRPWS